MKKEYGGYIEFENYDGIEYHHNALALNCGRNCLSYLIRTKAIKKIYIPYFICSSVTNICKKNEIEYEFYSIDEMFQPRFTKQLENFEFLYIVNYYGQLDNEYIKFLKCKYTNLIIDNSQAFFQYPVDGIDTLYTCRKFFGVPDGAYLYTNANVCKLLLEEDISYDRMNYLLGRYEKKANEFYSDYVNNNQLFSNEPVKRMSKLTHNLLRPLNYLTIKNVRNQNFVYLYNQFKDINKLDLNIPVGAFMYPLYIDNGKKLRKILQMKNIYIPTLWPDVFDICKKQDLEYKFAENILPLPVDQRYNIEDMKYISNVIMNEIKNI